MRMCQWLLSCLFQLLIFSLLFIPAIPFAAVLENPSIDSTQSGTGVVFGWKCSAGTITIRFDGGDAIEAVYGSPRGDTVNVCGDENNGYVLLWNWNLFTPGAHHIAVYDDGVEFASATFSIVSTGVEFLQSNASTFIPNFPFYGDVSTLTWSDASQGFELTDVQKAGAAGAPMVAGKWLLSVDFASEDCNWTSAPSQTTGSDILDLAQNGSAVSGLAPSIDLPLSGVVTPDEEFSLLTSAISQALDASCLVDQSFLFQGNFLTGDMTTIQTFALSGSCGDRNTCSREFVGTISLLSAEKSSDSSAALLSALLSTP